MIEPSDMVFLIIVTPLTGAESRTPWMLKYSVLTTVAFELMMLAAPGSSFGVNVKPATMIFEPEAQQ